ncbi:hypothetical protein BHE90_015116 [Fusarium euwallaceae]|uniref:Prion-inhibition and propagation HeLo domain-containing protein n=1 Tax=Fusarium euwallaceae TaxID=1147111 RepID=A0A430L425_9HYPO|nr:hypothetical protein BHE90_015116 [Fusarium euwallaceae]
MADCPDDSPLSTTGNITGILTFALGLFTFALALYTVTRNENVEKQYFESYRLDRQAYASRLKDLLSSRWVSSNMEVMPLIEEFDDCIQRIEDHLKAMNDKLNINNSKPWYWRRSDLASLREAADLELQFLGALQLTILFL